MTAPNPPCEPTPCEPTPCRPTPCEPTHRTPWLRLSVVLGLLAFSGVTLATNVVPTRDDLRATRRMLEQQRDENETTRARIAELREDADALRHDPWVVRRVLREELNLTDEGEIRVR